MNSTEAWTQILLAVPFMNEREKRVLLILKKAADELRELRDDGLSPLQMNPAVFDAVGLIAWEIFTVLGISSDSIV